MKLSVNLAPQKTLGSKSENHLFRHIFLPSFSRVALPTIMPATPFGNAASTVWISKIPLRGKTLDLVGHREYTT